jgi:hypothetical protein
MGKGAPGGGRILNTTRLLPDGDGEERGIDPDLAGNLNSLIEDAFLRDMSDSFLP